MFKNLILAVALFALPCFAQAACHSEKAEKAAGSVKSWSDLQQFSITFAACDKDDGASEMMVDTVEKMFTAQWAQVGQIEALDAQHKGFKKFVLAHIDCTMGDPAAIGVKATAQCPADAKAICHDIAKMVKQNQC